MHPPISDTESKEERSSGLHDAACCDSDLFFKTAAEYNDEFVGRQLRNIEDEIPHIQEQIDNLKKVLEFKARIESEMKAEREAIPIH
jgi:hypothetical protein